MKFDNIDPLIHQAGCELSKAAGKDCRELMLRNGMTEQEVDEVVKKAFAWRYPEEDVEPLTSTTEIGGGYVGAEIDRNG